MHVYRKIRELFKYMLAHRRGHFPRNKGIIFVGAFCLNLERLIVFRPDHGNVFGAYLFKVVKALILCPYSGRHSDYAHYADDFGDNLIKVDLSAPVLHNEPALLLDNVIISYWIKIFSYCSEEFFHKEFSVVFSYGDLAVFHDKDIFLRHFIFNIVYILSHFITSYVFSEKRFFP